MNRALHPCLAAPRASNLFAIEDAQTFNAETCHNGQITASQGQQGPVIQTLIGDSIVPDDSAGTLRVTLAHPAANFLLALADSPAYALDPTVVGPDITNKRWTDTLEASFGSPTGQGTSGMFYLFSGDHSTGVVLRANRYWWGIGLGKQPYLDEIGWALFANASVADDAYRSGQYDIGFPTPDQLADARTQPDYHEAPLLALQGVSMDWATPPFDNLDTRLAFCLAIDRDALNQSVYKTSYLPSWHMVP
jgi:ABC-type transport system substrate-binding protein